MAEGKAVVGELEIWWEDFGDRADPTVLLVMGAQAQATAWLPYFYEPIVAAGHHVVRFDNRDIGLTTWVEDFERNPYDVPMMAADAAGLLDALGIDKAHWVGASMGGMICQQGAIDYPGRLLSLTSIMSSPSGPNDPDLPDMEEKVARAAAALENPDDAIAAMIGMFRTLSGSRYPFDEAAFRSAFMEGVGRGGFNPKCAHGLAVERSPSRRERLGSVSVPTLVLHGSEDPILPLEHGRATAAAIPGARLVIAEGFGHDLPPEGVHEYLDPMLEMFAAVRRE